MKHVLVALASALAVGCAAPAGEAPPSEDDPSEPITPVVDDVNERVDLTLQKVEGLERCAGCGPVPDPWRDVRGPVPDPWSPPDPRP